MIINFLNPDINKDDINAVVDNLKSGWLAPGKQTYAFERKFSQYLQAKGATMMNSATAALHTSLVMAGVTSGDEVITTPLSYVATSNVILYQGAKPVFVDVDPNTGLIDIDKIAAKITKKTKAIIPVHLYGQMVDMKKLKKIADKYGLKIIEDAAHAIESARDGVRPGQLSFSACFSFHIAKNITCGQGGALVSNISRIIDKAKILRRDGIMNVKDVRIMKDLGYKYDSTEFQAAMLLNQMNRIDDNHRKRLKVMQNYMEGLEDLNISFPLFHENTVHSGHMFVVWVDPKKRDNIRNVMKIKGIQTSIHYNPIHLEPYYRKRFHFKRGDFPTAERLGSSTITLPTYAKLNTLQQEFIIQTLKSLL